MISPTTIESSSLMTTDSLPSKESELVVRCQAGDMQAFEDLFTLYQADAYNIAYGMLGNPEDARDMTQEAFVRAYENIHKFRRQASFRTWIARITTNLCLDELRKRKRQRTDSTEELDGLESSMVAETPSPLDSLLAEERHQLLRKAIESLPDKYRTLIVLRDIRGYSYQEIAEIVDCSLGRVKSGLHEARQELKRILTRRYAF